MNLNIGNKGHSSGGNGPTNNVVINQDGQLLSPEGKPVDAFGKPLPEGSKPLQMNDKNVLTDEKGTPVDPQGKPIKDGATFKVVDGQIRKITAEGKQTVVNQSDTLAESVKTNAPSAFTVNGKFLKYSANIKLPSLTPASANKVSPGPAFAQIYSIFGEPYSREEINDAIFNGIETFDFTDDFKPKKVSLESSLGNTKQGKELAALVTFIRNPTDANGKVMTDEYGDPLAPTTDEFFELVSDNPEMINQEIVPGKTLEQLTQNGAIVSAVYLSEFLDTIMIFMISVKKVLESLSITTQGQLKQAYNRHMAAFDTQMEALKDLRSENEKAHKAFLNSQEEVRKQKKCELVNKIVTAILFIVSIAMAVIPGIGGVLSAALMAATIAIATLTLVDSLTGGKILGTIIGGLVKGVMELVSKTLEAIPGVSKEIAGPIAAALVMLLVIVMIVVSVVATRTSPNTALFSAGSKIMGNQIGKAVAQGVAKEVATQTIVTAFQNVVRQIALQVVMLFTSVFTEGIKYAWESANPGKDMPMWLNYLAMAITMVVVISSLAVAVKDMRALMDNLAEAENMLSMTASSTSGTVQIVKNRVMEMTMALTLLFEVVTGSTSIAKGVYTIRQGEFLAEMSTHKEEIATLEALLDELVKVMLKLMGVDEDSLNQMLQQINEEISNLVQGQSKFWQSMEGFGEIFTALSK